MECTIRLIGADFFARVGHTQAERDAGGRLQVDVELVTTVPEDATGDLKATIDYAQVHSLVQGIVRGGEHALLEDIAAQVLDALGSVGARHATVRVRKPDPPIDGRVAAAEVEVSRAYGAQ